MVKKQTLQRMLAIVSAFALAAVTVFAISGCASGQQEEPAQETDAVVEQSPDSPGESSETAQAGRALVVYYSATGNTEAVADYIAEEASADIFAIEPSDPYTEEDLDWTEEGSRVNREHEDESLREIELVSTQVDNWDSYSTVFIGYPIWWGGAAWPVNGFVSANDFSGKTMIPFATSSDSGMGSSATNLEKLANGGDWQEGMRFSGSASRDAVSDWVKGLEL